MIVLLPAWAALVPGAELGEVERCNSSVSVRARELFVWLAAGAGAFLLASCGGSTRHVAGANGCTPARTHVGAPPAWTASAWSDSSPGFTVPYALASGDSAAAFMFSHALRVGHPTDPANKVLWVVRYPRDGKPLIITARWSEDPSLKVRISQPANSSPGEIYPTYIDLPKPGCWKLGLKWGAHRANVDLRVQPWHGTPGSRPATAQAGIPGPLHGMPVGRTGLRLLVSADPPFVLDVDTGAVKPVTGLNTEGNPVLTVMPIGRDAVIWLDRHTGPVPRAEIYAVRHGTTRAARIASGWEVAPAESGRAIWLLSFQTAHRCTLSLVGLNGRTQRRHRPIPCSTQLLDAGSQTVLINNHTVSDPATGYPFLGTATDTLWAVVDGYALTSSGTGPPLALTDLHTGVRWPLPWPSVIVASDQSGTDQAVVQRHGRLIALDFADPAYRLTGTQLIDIWLLEPATRRFQHVPDMPAAVHLKATSMTWTDDRRLVMLAQSGGPAGDRELVAIWKPGKRQLAVRPVRLPARNSGSDTFAVW